MRLRLMAPLLLPLAFAACGNVQQDHIDAAPGAPDAPPGTPDAMTPTIDAAPGTPDATPATPDAMIPTIDAAPGTPDAAGCTHCNTLITMGVGIQTACPMSIDLYNAWVTCICDMANCGDSECLMECTGSGTSTGCDVCVNTVSSMGGACFSQVSACLADM